MRELACQCPHGNKDEEDHEVACPWHTVDVVLPENDPRADPGWRLHLMRAPYENAQFSEEQVLPEKVNDPWANRIKHRKEITLKITEVVWLRDALDDVISRWNREQGTLVKLEDQVKLGHHQNSFYSTILNWDSDEQLHVFVVTCDVCGKAESFKVGKNYNRPTQALVNWQINHRTEHT